MIYEILSASKSDLATEEAVVTALKKQKPGFTVENITSNDDEWTVRLVAADDDKPDFLKKKDDSAESDDSSDPDADSDDDSSEEGDTDDDSEGDEGEDKGEKKEKGDAAAEVKKVIDELTNLFTDLGGKIDELQAAHDEKADKLKDISDTVGEDGMPGGGPEGMPEGMPGAGPSPEDVGPTPGKPAGPPRPPMPARGMDKRKPGLPGAPGGGIPAFTNFQVATHPGIDENGEKISLTAAATALEADSDFTDYEVVGMTENPDGSFSAKLKLKTIK